ncbi:type VII toxin-antitoxin system MntA family adenylyltransferase antitoxin [Pseudothermotoga thermarum]|uniref:DNA polymerase beta domain protein region n=1 Tax=Pseudothermotoga thermarum DSM 5069 TaxID=688269 RepID=F7YUI8_9THEM|nr:nucleotidyltransferase domain-containing protein [Pseudothermotoga thermarum]AEH51459.1 DNA polymerase beta domain protein region [Pseudothermotoga thermarum DSM 5069]
MMKVRDPDCFNTVIEKIKGFPEVIAIILFGSYAKGTAKEISDIDIAVVVRNPDKYIEGEIGSMYSPNFDVVLFHRLPLHIQFEVFKHGKEIFCRDEKKLLEIKRMVFREYIEMSDMYERIKRKVLA